MGSVSGGRHRSLAAGYSPGEQELLRAVTDLVRADNRMRQSLGDRLGMGANDLRALRYVMEAERRAEVPTAGGLSQHLGISTAATTVMVDRLVAMGHLHRAEHPTDRRSKTLVVTPHARQEARTHLQGLHDRMQAVAAAVPEASRPAVIGFLRELAQVMVQETDGAP